MDQDVATSEFDPEEAALLLAGSEQEIGEGLRRIDLQLRRRMWAVVRHRFPGLSSEDIEDVWQEALMAVLQSTRAGRLDLNRPLVPWITAVVLRRATDRRRRRTSGEAALSRIGGALERTRVGDVWAAYRPADRAEGMEAIRHALAGLPPRQRQVMQAFVDEYPETEDLMVLRERASEIAGETLTSVAVKRALQEARKKVREALTRVGIELD